VHIHYLPKIPKGDNNSFYDLMFEKFKILQLTQYRRVLFMDSDVLPLENLDYLFELSDRGAKIERGNSNVTLMENLVVATFGEPSNGGFIMLTPGLGEYEQYEDVRAKQVESAKDLPHPKFDFKLGWGHNFRQNHDQWEAIKMNGTNWRFWGGHVDQGLLYYWVKYVKKEVSLVIGDHIQNWSTDASGNKYMQHQLMVPLDSLPEPYGLPKWSKFTISEHRPYVSYNHFTGNTKPWTTNMPIGDCFSEAYKRRKPKFYWFHMLCQVNKKLNMGLDLSDWNTEKKKIGDPLLGGKPNWDDMSARMDKLNAAAKGGDNATKIN